MQILHITTDPFCSLLLSHVGKEDGLGNLHETMVQTRQCSIEGGRIGCRDPSERVETYEMGHVTYTWQSLLFCLLSEPITETPSAVSEMIRAEKRGLETYLFEILDPLRDTIILIQSQWRQLRPHGGDLVCESGVIGDTQRILCLEDETKQLPQKCVVDGRPGGDGHLLLRGVGGVVDVLWRKGWVRDHVVSPGGQKVKGKLRVGLESRVHLLQHGRVAREPVVLDYVRDQPRGSHGPKRRREVVILRSRVSPKIDVVVRYCSGTIVHVSGHLHPLGRHGLDQVVQRPNQVGQSCNIRKSQTMNW